MALASALFCLSATTAAGQQSPSSSTGTDQSQSQPAKPSAGASTQTPSTQTPSTQNPSKQPSAESTPSIQEAPVAGAGKVAGTSNDRLFYALPNFLSVESVGKLPPLTPKQKFQVVARGSFDYIQVPWYGFLSALSQAENSEPAYGQGWDAYGKRFGTAFADGTIENFMTGAILPSLLRQDPRYYQSGKGGFMRRAVYAASRNFITLSDSGKKEFNFSEIVGGGLSASISTFSYHPKSTYISTPTNPHKFIPSDRTVSNTAKVWGTQLGYDTITIVVKEFWPDIHRKLSKKTKTALAAEGGAVR